MSFHCDTLDSGLRIASEAMPNMETVAMAISVDVGARWEREAQHGISHLLEHMAFKGTQRFSAQHIAELFDSIGGHFNAFTSHEHTVYYVKVLKEHWQTAADVLCDILQHSLFDDEELAREKGVILQELAMHHDTPDDLVFDHFQEAVFGTQALGRSILGTESSISAQPRQALIDFVAQHYHAPRIAVSAAGAIDQPALHDFFAQHVNFNHASGEVMESANYIGGEAIMAKELEQLQLLLGIPSLPITDERYYALQLLSTMLGGGMSSRLFQEIREKRGLVYTIQTLNASYADCGVLSIYAATGAEQAEELIQVTCDELKRFTETISEDELQRAKQQHIANLRMSRENTATLAEWIGRHLLQFGEYRDASMLQQKVESITLTDVKTLSETLFDKPNLSLAALGPTQHLMPRAQIAEALAA